MAVAPEPLRAQGDAYRTAMARAGRLLALRSRSECELRERLTTAGFDPEVVERVTARLTEVGLIDDRAFARAWVEERSRARGLGERALLAELEAKGVARAVAEEAVTEAGLDEDARALELAHRLFPKVAGAPVPRQAARLHAMLLRRGLNPDAVEAAVRAVSPPEGWD